LHNDEDGKRQAIKKQIAADEFSNGSGNGN